ncbi:MAG: protein kinase, partial [Desulfobacterales bacterium]|nr:protein kinase [Desulfobacterales bacterium]
MAMSPDRWKEITPSQFPWEREALAYVRRHLPDHEPYRAWSNFEFIAGDGSVNEVDLLVAGRNGFFLVEIKSRPGLLSGDAGNWVWRDPDGRVATMDNPLYLTNRKAKKLASLLKSRKAFDKVRCPYLDALVFCSAENLTSKLEGIAASHVCFRDRDNDRKTGRPGIMGALINRKAPGLKPRVPPISKPMVKAIGRALDQAGVRPSRRLRQVGDYRLDRLLFQHPGDVWQDWKATHVITKKIKKRVRIYNVSRAESKETRDLIYKAAKREFQLINQLRCEWILNAEVFTDHELGPAMVYPYYPGAQRLDHYLKQRFDDIGVDIKLMLIRQIAEAVKFAHGKGILHRALSPCSILVRDPEGSRPRVKILDWQAGRAMAPGESGTSSGGSTCTIHPDRLLEDASLLYMSPEGRSLPDVAGEYVDVFSLGAVAYHIFTGEPPAASPMDLARKLSLGRSKSRTRNYPGDVGLDISLVMDGAGKELRELIQYSTNPDVLNRYESADEFLEQLQLVEDEFTEPDQEVAANPLDANAGDGLEGGFLVKERLGRGGSATAFLVERGGKEVVLKLANRPELNQRLKTEFQRLKELRHNLIVEPYEEVKISGLAGFTMRRAGRMTLARRLREEGTPQLEFLKRYGEDLLRIVRYLEEKGKYHRDVKPENIGVGPDGKKGKERLFLFDFSLSKSSLDNIRLGTLKYHDPFITLRRPARWDVYDERFTAAMTLHEMAAGVLPTWGDGQSDPALTGGEVHIASESFDADIRGAMTAFFTREFQRAREKRCDNAEEMLK